jgi:hydrogenase expression/formation protein HypE
MHTNGGKPALSLNSGPACPVPLAGYSHILMAHGGGGRLTQRLLEKVFYPAFKNPLLEARHDGAVFKIDGAKLAMTTDSYVIHPLFFPGGDIGSLAINGTVNDLAMCGARPLYLSAGFILEEGFPMADLQRIVHSMQIAAEQAGVQVITGDTKVVNQGKGDGVFINTAGIGVIEHSLTIAPDQVKPGDAILLSGDLGRHGMAIMAAREGLQFETTLQTDCAPLAGLVLKLIAAGIQIHCLRDLTRGGLASALNEIAETCHCGLNVEENAMAVPEEVRGACEMLGLDPLYVANEGRFVAFVDPEDAPRALDIMRQDPVGTGANRIGQVQKSGVPLVTLASSLGTHRIVDRISGEQLPRIC